MYSLFELENIGRNNTLDAHTTEIENLNTNVSAIPVVKYKDIFIPLGSSSANTGLSGSTKIISVTHTNKYSSTCVNLGLAPLNKFWYAVCDEPVEVGDACVRIAYV